MTTRMLIDGRHPEETRVAVVKGSRIEEFDFEAAARKQIKGNIYLAMVTRVCRSIRSCSRNTWNSRFRNARCSPPEYATRRSRGYWMRWSCSWPDCI